MRNFKNFAKSTGANVAIMFSLAAVPVITTGGMAIDYMSAAKAKSSMQQAVDDAVLAAGAADEMSQSKLETLVAKFLEKNHSNEIWSEITKIDVIKTTDEEIRLVVSGNFETNFMGLIGYDKLDIEVTAVVKKGFNNMEIALVLDNTGSMNSDSKLSSLKTSAKVMVDELFDNKSSSTELKIGIVPFSKYVNVGVVNRNKPWMDVPADTSEDVTATRDVTEQVPGSETNCGDRSYDTTVDGVTTTNTYYDCDYEYIVTGTEEYTYTNSSVWNGCVGSRNHPLNVRDLSPNVRIPAIMEPSTTAACPRPITRMTDSQSTIKTEIDALTATGSTYIPGGLMWGWRLLSNAAPFRDAVTYNKMSNENYTKVIVLMTDGMNTVVPVYPEHTGDGGDATTTNALTAELCENIKLSGTNDKQRILIYAVTFAVTDPDVKSLLKSCATNDKYFFDAADQMALTDAFQKIGKSLVNLSLAK